MVELTKAIDKLLRVEGGVFLFLKFVQLAEIHSHSKEGECHKNASIK